MLLVVIGCSRTPQPPAFYRFIDHEPNHAAHAVEIDGMRRRVLDPSLPEESFALHDLPRHGVLDFSIGLSPAAADSRVLFEIMLRNGADAQPLYRQTLSAPGWRSHQLALDLPARSDDQLIFRRKVLAGPARTLREAPWGDPLLLTAIPSGQPSVILISIDTLRADQLGVYGNSTTRTPTFDALARGGVMFARALSPSAWTLPSHAALLHGTLMSAFPTGAYELWYMPAALEPLPEALRRRGYLTAAFTGGGFLSTNFGFARGFDEYYEFFPFHEFFHDTLPDAARRCPLNRFDGPDVFRRARQWLQSHARAPFFLFVHTYEVHDTCPFQPGLMWRSNPGPAERARELAYYDGLLERTDGLLAGLLQELDALHLRKTTLVVLTADHGEGFWEHGSRTHGRGKKLYEELVHVPLMVRWPERLPSGTKVPEPVSLIDVAPTILRLLHVPPPASMRGHALPGLGLHFPGRDAAAAAVFRELQHGAPPGFGILRWLLLRPPFVQCDDLLAVWSGRYKLVGTGRGKPPEIYDMAVDPGERHNIAGRLPALDARFAALRAQYWRTAAQVAPRRAPPVRVNAATRERLRALGYAGK